MESNRSAAKSQQENAGVKTPPIPKGISKFKLEEKTDQHTKPEKDVNVQAKLWKKRRRKKTHENVILTNCNAKGLDHTENRGKNIGIGVSPTQKQNQWGSKRERDHRAFASTCITHLLKLL